MAKDKNSELVIWPEYFDSNLTRKEGRRVPKDMAVPSPSCEDIHKVSRKLGLYPSIENDKAYPSRWYSAKGRVKVKKKHSKTETLKLIADRLR